MTFLQAIDAINKGLTVGISFKDDSQDGWTYDNTKEFIEAVETYGDDDYGGKNLEFYTC